LKRLLGEKYHFVGGAVAVKNQAVLFDNVPSLPVIAG